MGAYIFTIAMSSSWIGPLVIVCCLSLFLLTFFIFKSILSDMNLAFPASFDFHLHVEVDFNI